MISSIVNSLTPSHRPNDAVIGEIAAARSEHNERTLPEVPVRVTGEGEAATSVRETQSRRVPEPMTPAMTPAGPAQVPPHPQNATPRTVLHSVMQRSATIFLSPKYIVGAAIVHFILEAIAAVVVLSISWEEPCSDPLRPFIIVRVVLTGIRLQFHLISVRAERRNPNSRPPSRNMVGVIESLQFVWFILGNVWLFGSTCANDNPVLYYGTLGFLALSYLVYGLPGIIMLALICLLPVVVCLVKARMRRLQEERKETIRRLPTLRYRPGCLEEEDPSCCICLDGYKSGETLRQLACKHAFHKDCIDEWLERSLECPLCKAPVGRDAAQQSNERGGRSRAHPETSTATAAAAAVAPDEEPDVESGVARAHGLAAGTNAVSAPSRIERREPDEVHSTRSSPASSGSYEGGLAMAAASEEERARSERRSLIDSRL